MTSAADMPSWLMTRARTIRPATVDDAESIAAIYAPYVVDTAVSFEVVPPTPAEICSLVTSDPRLPWFVAERAGRVDGYAYASVHRSRAGYRWSVDTSVYLAPEERRQGTGRALYDALLPTLRALGYVSAFAGIALPNDASVGLHEALGFEPVARYRDVGFKLGAWHDVGWWQLRLQGPPTTPAEPRPWTG